MYPRLYQPTPLSPLGGSDGNYNHSLYIFGFLFTTSFSQTSIPSGRLSCIKSDGYSSGILQGSVFAGVVDRFFLVSLISLSILYLPLPYINFPVILSRVLHSLAGVLVAGFLFLSFFTITSVDIWREGDGSRGRCSLRSADVDEGERGFESSIHLRVLFLSDEEFYVKRV